MTADDVREFLLFRKQKGVGSSDIAHDISALDDLCSFYDNACVGKCLALNPGLKPKKKSERLNPLPYQHYQQILERSKEIPRDDFHKLRAYTMVLMYICTGARSSVWRS